MLTTTQPTSALAHPRPIFPTHPDAALQKLLVPVVQTTARPTGGYLLASRKIIEQDTAANQALLAYRGGHIAAWELNASLNTVLCDRMPAPPGAPPAEVVEHQTSIGEAALYLTAELEQLPAGILITSKVTGKAIACLTEAHFWQPPDVPREMGGMQKPQMRLRPDVEAFLLHHAAEEGRFEQVMETWRGRLAPEVLPGRDKLALVTQEGRKGVIDAVRHQMHELLSRAQGPAGLLLGLIRPQPTVTDGYQRVGDVTVNADQKLRVPDALSVNPSFDPAYALSAKVSAAWATGIGQAVVDAVRDGRITCAASDEDPVVLYLAPPDEAKALRAAGCDAPILVVWAPAPVVGVTRLAGEQAGVFAPQLDGYRIEGRELHDRWEVRAQVRGVLYVDPRHLRVIDVGDVPVTGITVEIL